MKHHWPTLVLTTVSSKLVSRHEGVNNVLHQALLLLGRVGVADVGEIEVRLVWGLDVPALEDKVHADDTDSSWNKLVAQESRGASASVDQEGTLVASRTKSVRPLVGLLNTKVIMLAIIGEHGRVEIKEVTAVGLLGGLAGALIAIAEDRSGNLQVKNGFSNLWPVGELEEET